MKRNISIVVVSQQADGALVTHSSHTTLEGEDVTCLGVHEKIKDFLQTVEIYHLAVGEKVVSHSHSIFS